jgi:hypothetical protein
MPQGLSGKSRDIEVPLVPIEETTPAKAAGRSAGSA